MNRAYYIKIPATQEMIDDWEEWNRFVSAYISREIEKSLIAEEKRIEDEFLNGSPSEKPVGFLPAGYTPE